MHQRIVATVGQLRQDLARHLDDKAIHDACRQAGHCWRDCILTPAAIVHWFIIQTLHGHTALEQISLVAGRACTGAAYCLARSHLPLRVYEAVLRASIKALVPDTHSAGLWPGRYRNIVKFDRLHRSA